MNRVVIVGPLPPHRGGIARHTAELASALGKSVEVVVLTPKKLFPRLLYPGVQPKNSGNSEQPNISGLVQVRTLRWSQILFSAFLYRFSEGTGLVVVWWTWFLSPITIALALVAEIKSVPCAVFCHNVLPHEANWLTKRVSVLTLRRFHRIAVQSASELAVLNSFHKSAASTVIPHPVYESQHQFKNKSKLDSKKINVLFFGFVRPYKGIQFLVEMIPNLPQTDFHLQIAGETWDTTMSRKLWSLSAKVENFEFIEGYVSEATKSQLFEEADVVILPYESASGSGVLADARGFRVPVILSDKVSPSPDFRENKDGLRIPIKSGEDIFIALNQFKENRAYFYEAWGGLSPTEEWDKASEKVLGLFDE